MLSIRRLNNDSSWLWTFAGLDIIVDPWLVGPEIDGFAWLNKQWHVDPVVEIEDLPKVDAILISQSYNDHCHLKTLRKLDPNVPILATQKAFDKLRSKLKGRDVHMIPNDGPGLHFKGLQLLGFHPGKKMDPVYFAVALINFKDQAIFYAPHGFPLQEKDLMRLKPYSMELLITTLTHFKLPAIMGGEVNPGVDKALALASQLNAKRLLNTHDEKKKMKGLVATMSKVKYTDPSTIHTDGELEILNLDNINAKLTIEH